MDLEGENNLERTRNVYRLCFRGRFGSGGRESSRIVGAGVDVTVALGLFICTPSLWFPSDAPTSQNADI